MQNDVRQFYTVNLNRIKESYQLPDPWPHADDIQALTNQSHGLFIYAATSVKFIADRKHSDPVYQLTQLLTNSPTVAKDSSSPHHYLDGLYTQVLNNAFPDIAARLLRRLKTVLGTIIFLRDPLSTRALGQLLGLDGVQNILVHLHSVLVIPDNDDEVIRLLHPSFYDFMTHPLRCRDHRFLVTAETQHTLITRACLESMKELKRDICRIKNLSLLNNEVPDLHARIMKFIPPHLQYACRHWASHLANSMLSDVLLDLVKDFCLNHLLHWVEVLSLLGELRSALFAVDVAQRKLEVSPVISLQ